MRRIGISMLILVMAMVPAMMACEGDQGPAGPRGPQGPAGPSVIVAYASINAAVTPAVYSFGGTKTTSVAVTRVSQGIYDLDFTGDFSSIASMDEVTILATILDTNNYNVASLSNDFGSVNATTLHTRVYVWSTATTPNPYADEDFSIVVLN